jgi:hypothetical protein
VDAVGDVLAGEQDVVAGLVEEVPGEFCKVLGGNRGGPLARVRG